MISSENNPKVFFSAGVNQYKSEHYLSGYRSYMSVRQTRYLKEIDQLEKTSAYVNWKLKGLYRAKASYVG